MKGSLQERFKLISNNIEAQNTLECKHIHGDTHGRATPGQSCPDSVRLILVRQKSATIFLLKDQGFAGHI